MRSRERCNNKEGMKRKARSKVEKKGGRKWQACRDVKGSEGRFMFHLCSAVGFGQ